MHAHWVWDVKEIGLKVILVTGMKGLEELGKRERETRVNWLMALMQTLAVICNICLCYFELAY